LTNWEIAIKAEEVELHVDGDSGKTTVTWTKVALMLWGWRQPSRYYRGDGNNK